MRKNPYHKNIKDFLPLFMQGPSTTTALTNTIGKTQNILEGCIKPQTITYNIREYEFDMVRAPLVDQNKNVQAQNILDLEMGKTEVTQSFFKAVTGLDLVGMGYDSAQKPATSLTWFDSVYFCNELSKRLGLEPCYKIDILEKEADAVNGPNSLSHILKAYVAWKKESNGFRLPTLEEWTVFAKAGTGNDWAGCNDIFKVQEYGWYEESYLMQPKDVGLKKPNEWGLYDMSGNVFEWCWDFIYEHMLTYDNEDDRILEPRILIGGCFQNNPEYWKIDSVTFEKPSAYDNTMGFRICRTIK